MLSRICCPIVPGCRSPVWMISCRIAAQRPSSSRQVPGRPGRIGGSANTRGKREREGKGDGGRPDEPARHDPCRPRRRRRGRGTSRPAPSAARARPPAPPWRAPPAPRLRTARAASPTMPPGKRLVDDLREIVLAPPPSALDGDAEPGRRQPPPQRRQDGLERQRGDGRHEPARIAHWQAAGAPRVRRRRARGSRRSPRPRRSAPVAAPSAARHSIRRLPGRRRRC